MYIKPIETKYNGVRFRSRLEAKWALFMDSMDVKWLYEAEGYELDSGRYLPDFWLPDLKVWLEIKHADISRETQQVATAKLIELTLKSHHPAVLVQGAPSDDLMWCQCYACDRVGVCHGMTVNSVREKIDCYWTDGDCDTHANLTHMLKYGYKSESFITMPCNHELPIEFDYAHLAKRANNFRFWK